MDFIPKEEINVLPVYIDEEPVRVSFISAIGLMNPGDCEQKHEIDYENSDLLRFTNGKS